MNDTELDEILKAWNAPPAPASLRERVQAGFAAGLAPKTSPGVLARWIAAFARRSLLAGVLLGAGALSLLVVAQAFPQTLQLFSPAAKVPYTVESEWIQYGDDGSSTVSMYITSYNDKGREITLSRSMPGDPLGTVHLHVFDFLHQLVMAFHAGEGGKAAAARSGAAAALVRAGCVSGALVGREPILNHETVASRLPVQDGQRVTLWRGPDLGCFPLRIDREQQQPGGTFRLLSRRQALKVTLNP